ncbi:MAG: bifunctional 5,10-methylenetetrahydrofolate dehydrogenase/5,10-methenyltetrahydrofolate cyclohydrolase [Oscillospiraceae bacterium]|nr:bifunctional 5,10-methylenetetrahydrofolate dehydrogenase/5,10-methenyltetrahydrofolate cyclohydrolase [Oscillospiraceae bacterium]
MAILSGKPVMESMVAELNARANSLKEKGITPCLAVVRVGNDPAAENYELSIRKRADMVGVMLQSVVLDEDISLSRLTETLDALSAKDEIHGILLYLPLPKALRPYEEEVLSHIAPKKDVDGVTAGSAAAIFTGNGAGFAPCTAEAAMKLLAFYGVELEGKHACVVGRSGVIGKPVAILLLAQNATISVCHSRTKDLSSLTKTADVLVVAAGKAGLISGAHVKEGAVVVDVGANRVDGKMVGDVLTDEVSPVASVSPVPGGVGMVTSSVLMEHTIRVAEQSL